MPSCFGGCLRAFGSDNNERKRFLEAAKSGDDQVAATLAASNPELVTCTTLIQRKTALHLAAENGHAGVMASILEMLLCQASLDGKGIIAQGADAGSAVSAIINSRDTDGRTPLITACGHNHVECVRLLLSNGAWREPVDARGNSAVHYAAAKGYLGVLLTLMTEFLDELTVEQRLLQESGVDNAPEGPLPNMKRLADVRNGAGFAPLHYAVWAKQSASVQILLQHGADLIPRNPRAGLEASIPCPGGSTPLHLAAMRGHIEISRLLLKTHYERVLEPMQLAAASTGQDVSRSILEVDPRTQVNTPGLVPYKVAQRSGFLSLASLLRPHIPLARLFSEDEHRVRFYGPPALKLLAAEALNRKLIASLDRVMSADKTTSPTETETRSTSPGIPTASHGHDDTVDTSGHHSTHTTVEPLSPGSHDTTSSTGSGAGGAGVTRITSSGTTLALATVQEEDDSSSLPVSPTAPNSNSCTGSSSSNQASGKACVDSDSNRRSDAATSSVAVSPFAAISLDPAGISECPSRSGTYDVLLDMGHTHDVPELSILPLPGAISEVHNTKPVRPRSKGQEPLPLMTSKQLYSAAAGSPRERPMSQSSSGAMGTGVGLGHNTARSAFTSLTPRCSAAELSTLLGDGMVLTTMPSLPGVVALQRGASITLVGAGQSTTGHTDNMAPLTGLDQLADVVEDQLTPATFRNRLSSNCLPILAGGQGTGGVDQDVEVPVPPMAATMSAITHRGSLDREISFPEIQAPITSPRHQHTSSEGQVSLHTITPPRSARRSLSGLRKAMSNALSGSGVEEVHHDASGKGTHAQPTTPTGTAATSATPQMPSSPMPGTPTSQVAAVSYPLAQPAHADGSDGEENECGVCLEHAAHVLVQPCQHAICGPCAKKMCSMNTSRTPHCPFCRAMISDFHMAAQS